MRKMSFRAYGECFQLFIENMNENRIEKSHWFVFAAAIFRLVVEKSRILLDHIEIS